MRGNGASGWEGEGKPDSGVLDAGFDIVSPGLSTLGDVGNAKCRTLSDLANQRWGNMGGVEPMERAPTTTELKDITGHHIRGRPAYVLGFWILDFVLLSYNGL